METKFKIIKELKETPKGVHLRGLSRIINSGLPNVKRFLKILEEEKVVRKEKDANLIKFKLKESQKTLAYLKQINTGEFLRLPVKIQNSIIEFLGELENKPLLVLIFGSYAKGTQSAKSDLDLLIIVRDKKDIKNIEHGII